jgi:hypothetical protein
VGIVLGVDIAWRLVLTWRGATLSASTMASLSGMEQRGLDRNRVMIYSCKAEEMSSGVVALVVGRSRSVR